MTQAGNTSSLNARKRQTFRERMVWLAMRRKRRLLRVTPIPQWASVRTEVRAGRRDVLGSTGCATMTSSLARKTPEVADA